MYNVYYLFIGYTDMKLQTVEKYTCTCGKTYKWKKSLSWHLRQECGKDPQQFCRLCTYKTHRKCHLYRHLRTVHKLNVIV